VDSDGKIKKKEKKTLKNKKDARNKVIWLIHIPPESLDILSAFFFKYIMSLFCIFSLIYFEQIEKGQKDI